MVATIVQIIMAVLKLAPLAIETKTAISNALALDPSVPDDLAKLLTTTADNYAAADANIAAWLAANPEPPPEG